MVLSNARPHPSRLVVTLPAYNGTLQWHPAMTPSIVTTSSPKLGLPHHSTLQWHPAMTPRPLPQSWSSPSPPDHSTMAPRPLPQSWSSPSPQPSHTTMAPHYNGTTSTWSSPSPPTIAARMARHPAISTPSKLVVTLPSSTIAPCNGTTSTTPCNGTLVPRPIRQSGSSPSPPIGSKNPYSYRYLGNYTSIDPR